MSASSLPRARRVRPASERTQVPSAPDGVVGSITPPTPATTKDAREVARYRAENRHTEAGNAERFIKQHGESLRFHSENEQWLEWCGTRWVQNPDGTVTRRMLNTVRTLIDRDPAFVVQSEKRAALDASLRIAADLRLPSGESVRVRQKQLDRHRHLLPVANGVVNLRTGELEQANPADLMTHGSSVAYDPTATSADWDKFIGDTTCGDTALATFLQRWAGYCATGEVSEQKMVFLIGDGANGKGVFTRALEAVLGDTVITAPITAFMHKKNGGGEDGPTPAIARMAGRRLVLASEGEQDARLAEALIKHLTGTETITARMLHANPIEFEPTAKITVSSNHKPVIIGTDRGIWRRPLLVPMNATFSNSGEPGTLPLDASLDQRLRQQLPAILRWVVDGAVAWYAALDDKGEGGLAIPPCVTTATADYQAEMDRIGSFIDETYVVVKKADGSFDQAARVRNADVFKAYVAWCEENGIDPLSMNGLARELGKKGLPIIQSSGRWRGGIRLPIAGERPGNLIVDGRLQEAATVATESDDTLPF